MKYKLDKKVFKSKLRSIKTKDKVKFHNYLVELLDIQPDSKVLDLGCGHGNTLMYIIPKLGVEGKAVGADIDEGLLAVAETILDTAIKNNQLELVKADLSKKLPFKSHSFDRIVCHNVLECIPDKVKFLNNCYQLLRRDGILLMSHCDFDTQIYNSSFPELTRKLIHNYSDTTQDWMETSDGTIGRKLYGIFKKTKFTNFESKVYVMENHSYKPNEYGYRIAQDIVKIAKESNKFSQQKLRQWVNNLKEKDDKAEYYYSGNTNIIIARR